MRLWMARSCALGGGRSLAMACVQVDEGGGAQQSCQRQHNIPVKHPRSQSSP